MVLSHAACGRDGKRRMLALATGKIHRRVGASQPVSWAVSVRDASPVGQDPRNEFPDDHRLVAASYFVICVMASILQ